MNKVLKVLVCVVKVAQSSSVVAWWSKKQWWLLSLDLTGIKQQFLELACGVKPLVVFQLDMVPLLPRPAGKAHPAPLCSLACLVCTLTCSPVPIPTLHPTPLYEVHIGVEVHRNLELELSRSQRRRRETQESKEREYWRSLRRWSCQHSSAGVLAFVVTFKSKPQSSCNLQPWFKVSAFDPALVRASKPSSNLLAQAPHHSPLTKLNSISIWCFQCHYSLL
ncbi:hypothetical protein AMECASPLE_019590 [Ameca splendens]|uniref:Secreted protein n=1 Tax=Ameca splendens TaxID=208324 RepID=A0ABV1AAG7_9TELE